MLKIKEYLTGLRKHNEVQGLTKKMKLDDSEVRKVLKLMQRFNKCDITDNVRRFALTEEAAEISTRIGQELDNIATAYRVRAVEDILGLE